MNNERKTILDNLEAFYKKEAFYEEKPNEGLLQNCCKCSNECWKNISKDVKSESKWNYFSKPYIGDEYKGELMCVGLNVNKGGGRNLQDMQIRGYNVKKRHENDIYAEKYQPGVMASLGNKKENDSTYIRFEDGMKLAGVKYNGTPLWHRIAVYSKIILDGCKDNLFRNYEELAEIYKRIIFTDVIKCSPATKSSKPNRKMEDNCIRYIFLKELEIIKPNNLIIMSHRAADLIRENKSFPLINGSIEDFPGKNKKFDFCQITIDKKIINVFYIVHPTSPGGNNEELAGEFVKFLKDAGLS